MFSTWYGLSKDLVKGTQSDKVLKDKAFRIASDPKYDGYQRGLSQMVHIVFDKKSKWSGIVTNEPNINWQLNVINQWLENLKEEKFIHHLETIFGVLI